MLQTVILWATVGLLLSLLYQADTWQFWCLLATYWAVSAVSRQVGRVDGIVAFLEMSDEEQARLKRALAQAKEDQL